jgi:hypothetical protein
MTSERSWRPVASYLKIASIQQKAACMWWMAGTISDTRVQRKFRIFCGEIPSHESILQWADVNIVITDEG